MAALETPRETATSTSMNNWSGLGLMGAAMRGIGGSVVRRVHCEHVDYSSQATRGSIQRANPDLLRSIFEQYASEEERGVKMMTSDDFIRKYLGLYPEPNYNRETVRLLASAADTTKDGLISFEEFVAFEAILCSPDALYLTAFEMFDNNASESITCDEFEKIIRHTQPVMEMDFDFNSDFIKRYFGADKKRQIRYHDFCQLLHDFYEEQGVQAFQRYDKEKNGYISSVDFQHIMMTVKSHLLSSFVKNNLIAVSGGTASHKVSFPYYAAFNGLLSKMELMKRVYLTQARGNLQLELSKEDFLHATQSYAQITPYEVEILFHLADLAHPGSKVVTFRDLERFDAERLKRISYIMRLTNLKAVQSKEERSAFTA
uniref:EF-hand domain-containing protein n=1 Tax=Plectus sambesii TaxID=2011161 RepID=A0A914WDR6_9BILA